MIKDPLVFIGHILDEIIKIENSIKNISKEVFIRDADIQDATIRRIEIIGEAVKNLSYQFRDKHKNVPWNKITGTRDKLIHHYFGVDLDLTWKIVKKEIPDLKKKIQKILRELENNKKAAAGAKNTKKDAKGSKLTKKINHAKSASTQHPQQIH